MPTRDTPPGHETEERTSTTSGSPQSPQQQTTGEAPSTGPGTDVSYRTEGGPAEELALGEDTDPARSPSPEAPTGDAPSEPPD